MFHVTDDLLLRTASAGCEGCRFFDEFMSVGDQVKGECRNPLSGGVMHGNDWCSAFEMSRDDRIRRYTLLVDAYEALREKN